MGVSKANLIKIWSVIPLSSLKPCQLPVINFPYLNEMYQHPCSSISKTYKVIKDAYLIVIHYNILYSLQSKVLYLLFQFVCIFMSLYLNQHPWSSYYHLCPRHCIIHLTSSSPISPIQTTIKATFKKNYRSSHTSISHFSSFLLWIDFNWSYMKTKSFCSSQLTRYFHREAFLSSWTRLMPFHTSTQVSMAFAFVWYHYY